MCEIRKPIPHESSIKKHKELINFNQISFQKKNKMKALKPKESSSKQGVSLS